MSPIRLLYWNVDRFGDGSLYSGKRPGEKDPEYKPDQSVQKMLESIANDRRRVLTNVVDFVRPHLISIVEVQPGSGAEGPGQVVADPTAVRLLWELRHLTRKEYRLVPPVISGVGGKAEAVAVYYDADRLQFLGPWGWGPSGADFVSNIGGGQLLQYPFPYTAHGGNALPNRPVANGWFNSGLPERCLAGQWGSYRTAGNVRLLFPSDTERRPWTTWFRDIEGGRGISLVSFHASSDQDLAAIGTGALAQIPAIAGGLGANEVRCVVGDFNVSAFDTTRDASAFQPLRQVGYTQQLNPPADHVGDVWPWKAYYVTHNRVAKDAAPWAFVGGTNDLRGYPGFSYASFRDHQGWYDAIDNVFTRYGSAAGNAARMTVVNPLTGSPYSANEAAPANVQRGSIGFVSQLDYPAVFDYDPSLDRNGIEQLDDEKNDYDALNTFAQWGNYGKVRSLSDHMPLAIDL